MKNTNAPATSTLDAHIKRYSSARADLLIMIVLTVVNIVLMFFGSETMMLFSASIPYIAVGMGYWNADNEMLIFGIIVAIVSLLLYFLCWLMSKKKYQWLIVAAVLFVIDSAATIWLYASSGEISSGIFDMVIHALVLYYLVVGIITGKKLKALKENYNLGEGIAETGNSLLTDSYGNEVIANNENSSYIRRAETDVKFRVLAKAEFNGHSIIFRRVKRTNELIIDGYVYDEIEMLVETPHILSAKINGELIQAGMRYPSFGFISVNGKEIAKKIRII